MKFDKASISACFEEISSKLYIKVREFFCLNVYVMIVFVCYDLAKFCLNFKPPSLHAYVMTVFVCLCYDYVYLILCILDLLICLCYDCLHL
jgi:hypothetical protein